MPVYWQTAEAAEAAAEPEAAAGPLDFNVLGPALVPPLLGLPVDVGLGKTSTARVSSPPAASGPQGRLRGAAARPRAGAG